MPKVKNYKPLKKATATAIAALLTLAAFSFGALCLAQTEIAHADSDSSTVNVNVSDGITIRVLDSTATTDLEELAFDFVPTDAGVSATKNAVVEVATSNETGYKLYVQSDWREDNTSSSGTYADSKSTAAHTTSLIHFGATSIPAVTDKIPTNLGTSYPYWYYYNDYYSANKVIPAFGNPDLLAELSEPTDSDKTTVPITVGVDTSIVAGTYRNKLVFTAIANELPVNYILHFDDNTADTATGTPADVTETVVATSDNLAVPAATMKRGDYVFLGWSEDPAATTATYKAGDDVTIIADNQKLSTDQVAEKTLYAVWHDDFWHIQNMQDMTPEVCASVYTPSNATGSVVTLVTTKEGYASVTGPGTPNVAQRTLSDIRDGKTYVVRKLADGNCWMTQNLNYAPVATMTNSYGAYYSYINTVTACDTDGWQLPNNSIFNGLIAKYGTPSLLTAVPFSAVLAGWYGGTTLRSAGTRAYYYSSDQAGYDDFYFLRIETDLSRPTIVYNTGRSNDFMPVRCVAQ